MPYLPPATNRKSIDLPLPLASLSIPADEIFLTREDLKQAGINEKEIDAFLDK
jgi:hypothetical protein